MDRRGGQTFNWSAPQTTRGVAPRLTLTPTAARPVIVPEDTGSAAGYFRPVGTASAPSRDLYVMRRGTAQLVGTKNRPRRVAAVDANSDRAEPVSPNRRRATVLPSAHPA